jgi:uncharacterized membrane protein
VQNSRIPLPDHISQQVETLAVLHAKAEKEAGFHQHAVESVTAFLGRPLFLNLTIGVIALWVLANILPRLVGLKSFDPPPFFWLQGAIGLGALLLTFVVLITQNRQSRLSERRAQLDLQVNLLAEQKIAKLIALMEELRRDIPTVKNRFDPEAEAMQLSPDPHAVLEALEEKIDEAATLVREAEDDVIRMG